MNGPRVFTSSPARRSRVPLLLGLSGMAGSGKTFSALRLARGIASVMGGPVHGVDTEANRMLHYAHSPTCAVRADGTCPDPSHFEFQHMPFPAPYAPLDYLDAIRQCLTEGAGVVVVDSGSDMHQGRGGMLDQQEQWLQDTCGDDQDKRDKRKGQSWIAPKRELDKLVLGLIQLNAVVIFCFRAKDKMQWGGKPVDLGTMAIADNELIFSMTAQALLQPGAEGVPTWDPPLKGEKIQTKLGPFKRLISGLNGPLSEDMGAIMGRWAMGDTTAARTAEPTRGKAPEPKAQPGPTSARSDTESLEAVLALVAEAQSTGAVAQIASANRAKPWTDEQRAQIKAAIQARQQQLQQ